MRTDTLMATGDRDLFFTDFELVLDCLRDIQEFCKTTTDMTTYAYSVYLTTTPSLHKGTNYK